MARDDKTNIDNQSISEADEAEAFKKAVEQTASAEALLAVHNAQNNAAKMTSISLNGSTGKLDEGLVPMLASSEGDKMGGDMKPLESLEFLTNAAMAAQDRFSNAVPQMP